MWRPYGEAVCSDPTIPVRLDIAAPVGSKLDVQMLLIQPHWDNTGRIYILNSSGALTLTGNNANLLAWLPPPSPSGLPPFIKLSIGVRVGSLWLLAAVPTEGAIVSAYVA